jgi:DNA-binding MarR family transcriptional regulator
VGVPLLGERYRGVDGHIGYLLRQASQTLRGAMDAALTPHRLTGAQYAVLSVLARDPGASGADLARACNTTPQAMNGVLATLAREDLVERRPHPTHGRILQVTLTSEGRQRVEAAHPAVRALERAIERDFTRDDVATVKAWLVASAQRLEQIAGDRGTADPAQLISTSETPASSTPTPTSRTADSSRRGSRNSP